MTDETTTERIAQLEKIVATQSEMILKLVEMMNHLGQETTATNERVDAANAVTSQQFEKISLLLQRLIVPLEGGQAEAN